MEPNCLLNADIIAKECLRHLGPRGAEVLFQGDLTLSIAEYSDRYIKPAIAKLAASMRPRPMLAGDLGI